MEVVQKVFAASPYDVSYKHVMSWNRAMDQVKRGEADAIVFSFYESSDKQYFVIPKATLAVDSGTNFVLLNSNKWRFKDAASLNQLRYIGVYKNTVWADPEVAKFESDNPGKFVYLHGENIVDRAFDMIRRGRIDAWEDSEVLLNYYMFRNGITDMRIESKEYGKPHTGTMLFSSKTPRAQEYAKFFSQGVEKLRRSGELAKILARYGLKPQARP